MRNIFLVTIFSSLALVMYAQPREMNEKVKALKIGIFTEELGLTASEATQFWPIYNQYEGEMKSLHKKMRANGKIDWDSKSDKEIEKLIEQRLQLEEEKLKIERKYYKKFKTVLPIKKVAKIHSAQRKFKMKVLRQSREGRRKRRK